MYKLVYFEISGVCNGKCPWCVTGNKSAIHNSHSSFVDPKEFEKVITRLIELKLIGMTTRIDLFSWGEPFLHPEFNEIAKILNKRNILFGISTNASRPINIKQGLLTNMDQLTISVPGFSQASYDRIHGFNFNYILRNIDSLLDNFKKAGFSGYTNMAYHIYQFNIEEIGIARDFCLQRKVNFTPSFAYLNDFNLAKSYLSNNLDYATLKNASKDLLFYYVDKLIASMPKDYSCPQYNYLNIDEQGNLLTCCVLPKNHPNYSLGPILGLSVEEIKTKKVSQSVCRECINSGIAYWMHNPCTPDFADCINYFPNKKEGYYSPMALIKKNLPSPFKELIKKYVIIFKIRIRKVWFQLNNKIHKLN